MDHFRSLYKSNNNSPKKRKQEAQEIRAKKRSELYTSTRNISPSPSSKSSCCSRKENQIENLKPVNPPEAIFNSLDSKINSKLTRQKAHILKFLAWKTEKAKQAQIKEKSKRAPFVVGTRNCSAKAPNSTNITQKTSFAPANHVFRPPATLQSVELKVIDLNKVRLINGTREETYHFIATPTKKLRSADTAVKDCNKNPVPFPRTGLVSSTSNKTPVATTKVTQAPLNRNLLLETAASIQQFPQKRKPNTVLSRPKTILPPIKRSTFKAAKKSNLSISNAFMAVTGDPSLPEGVAPVKLNRKLVIKKLIESGKPSEHLPVTLSDGNQENVLQNVAKKSISSKELCTESLSVEKDKLVGKIDDLKKHPLDSNTKSIPVSKKTIIKPSIGKTDVKTKRLTKTPLISKPKLGTKVAVQELPPKPDAKTVVLKSKSTLPPIKRSTFKPPKKTNSSISNAFMAVTKNTRLRKEAEAVKLNGKSAPKFLAKIDKPSAQIAQTPTEVNQVNPFLNIVTSTKRKSFSSKESSNNSILLEMDQLVSPVDDFITQSADSEKFNFVHYPVVKSEIEVNANAKTPDELHVTPDKGSAAQKPTTYLSPYVSVSRGKVGIKIEREKRNSVYMSVDKSITDNDTTAKERHIMATVHYYRKQLNDEICRLNEQCESWQQYKEANAHLVEETGSDMVNVTIGQTKLLTTKKLKQFGDLIDSCENGTKHDGAKPILTEDLEGFWSMVGLQIENVDKRFANLQRWKENNWKDPDEVPPKSTNSNGNLKKGKKLKPGRIAGPNRDLQKILRNAQAAFLRKKSSNSGLNDDVILTPSKSRQVLIRDRRSRSAAATVITVNTPKVIRKSSVNDQTTPTGITADSKMLPHIHGFRKSMNLFKNALLNKPEKKSPEAINCAPSRKSILKTPGSIRRPKSVIFNSPTLQFTVDDNLQNEAPPLMSPSKLDEEEGEERTYSLRTRNIKLRDLADIIIPE